MLSLTLALGARRPLSVLCLGAHADDIEIGCSGTLLQLIAERSRVTIHWLVFSGNARRAREARLSAARLSRGAVLDLDVCQFRDGFFPYEVAAIKERFEQLKHAVQPDIVFTHHAHDAHQDHRVIAELTAQTFRDHLVLEYEIPKYDGDLGRPTIFVPIDSAVRRRKIRHLMAAFPSQRRKHWYTADTFNALMRIRGVECAAPAGYAEAFHTRKLSLR